MCSWIPDLQPVPSRLLVSFVFGDAGDEIRGRKTHVRQWPVFARDLGVASVLFLQHGPPRGRCGARPERHRRRDRRGPGQKMPDWIEVLDVAIQLIRWDRNSMSRGCAPRCNLEHTQMSTLRHNGAQSL